MDEIRYIALVYMNIGLAAVIVVFTMGVFNAYLHYRTRNTIVEKLHVTISEGKQIQSVEEGLDMNKVSTEKPRSEPIYLRMDERPRCLSLSTPKIRPPLYQYNSLQKGIRSDNLNGL